MSDNEVEEIVKRRSLLCQEIMALKGNSGGMKFLSRLINLPEETLIAIRDGLQIQEDNDDT